MVTGNASAARLRLALAFFVVYVIWGSTYLAIRIGVQELPPALFAAVRFLIAGAVLALYARFSGEKFPAGLREWGTVAVVGFLLLVCANGLVVYGEQRVASNQAALIVATNALWYSGFGTLGARGQKLTRREITGLILGFAGVALLMLPHGNFSLDYMGAQLAILGAPVCWSLGSIYAKRVPTTTPPFMSAAMQMLFAGAVLSVIGMTKNEMPHWVWTRNAMLSLGYLIVFGSVLAYGAYIWLLHEVSPVALGTIAYVNPLVAVVLGWLMLGETLNLAQIGGMLVILLGVVLASRRGS